MPTRARRSEPAESERPGLRSLLPDALVGALLGGLVGALVAVNFVLIVGVDQGYEANLGEVFQHSVIGGVVTVLILLAGPVVGFIAARRLRARGSYAHRGH